MELEVFEIFERYAKLKTRKEKIQYLKDNGIPAVRDVCRGIYDERLEFIIPEGKPPYTPNRPESVPSSLKRKHRDFGMFVKGAVSAKQPQYKIERMYIQMLESIHAEDSEIVIDMVKRKAPKGLTKKIVEEAFPTLLS
tara:strand:- start:6 stop:419 length:414 start_codon:yes stop_codon:yes gene_type:complete